ncbi:peptidoglycan recognition protein 5 [Engraulis encrasicolus]|uniref:peptidoglycan recognition protein 5 n=1 Tax=Engraulis encrasicolus TaxID=184585 RepID=UPI002FD62D90
MDAQAVILISRADWGATSPRSTKKLREPAKRVVIHHTVVRPGDTSQDCATVVARIQRMHMEERRFDDIGYNFLVAQNGIVYEGRGWGVMGAHSKGHNQDSVGIAFIGNFNNEVPSPEALSSVKLLLKQGISLGYLCSSYAIFGHRDLGSTECPGNKLYPEIQRLKS